MGEGKERWGYSSKRGLGAPENEENPRKSHECGKHTLKKADADQTGPVHASMSTAPIAPETSS